MDQPYVCICSAGELLLDREEAYAKSRSKGLIMAGLANVDALGGGAIGLFLSCLPRQSWLQDVGGG